MDSADWHRHLDALEAALDPWWWPFGGNRRGIWERPARRSSRQFVLPRERRKFLR